MIVEFNKDSYINVDKITMVRWIDPHGIVIVDGQKIGVPDRETFDIILKAFKWVNDTIYDKDLNKRKRGRK